MKKDKEYKDFLEKNREKFEKLKKNATTNHW